MNSDRLATVQGNQQGRPWGLYGTSCSSQEIGFYDWKPEERTTNPRSDEGASMERPAIGVETYRQTLTPARLEIYRFQCYCVLGYKRGTHTDRGNTFSRNASSRCGVTAATE